MVGVINPVRSNVSESQEADNSKANGTSIDKQVAAAQNATIMLGPGQAWPAEGVQAGSMSSNSSHTNELSTGTIIGIIIVGVVFTVLCGGLFCASMMRRQGRSEARRLHERSRVTEMWSPISPFPPDVAPSQVIQTPTNVIEKDFEMQPSLALSSNQNEPLELVGDEPLVAELGPYKR
jgi:hypothetical protein